MLLNSECFDICRSRMWNSIKSLVFEGPDLASYLIVVRTYLYWMVKQFAEPEDSGTERSISRDQACLITVG
jgi:hypothetical protein